LRRAPEAENTATFLPLAGFTRSLKSYCEFRPARFDRLRV